MIIHENRLLADDSHEISYPFSKIRKDVANVMSVAMVIGTLRVNISNEPPTSSKYFLLYSIPNKISVVCSSPEHSEKKNYHFERKL